MQFKTSAILVTYNHEPYVIESLLSLINQSKKFDEIIIVDNNSQDKTTNLIEDAIKKFEINVNFIKNKINYGVNKAINMGLKVSSGDIIYLQSGDDLSHLNRNEIILFELSNNNKIQLFLTSYQIIDNNSRDIRVINRSGVYTDPKKLIKMGSGLPPMGMTIKRELIDIIGNLNETVANEDDILSFVAVLNGGIKIVDEILYKYRMHNASMSGWSTFESDNTLYINNYFQNLTVRISNYKEWIVLLEARDYKNKNNLINLLNKKINLTNYINDINKYSLWHRLFKLLLNYNYLNKSDVLVILFKNYGAILYKKLRKIRYS